MHILTCTLRCVNEKSSVRESHTEPAEYKTQGGMFFLHFSIFRVLQS